MNWKQIKNLLLLLLVAVNLLLFYFCYSYYQQREFTDGDTARQAVAVLEKNGISVSPALLSVQNDSADILRCAYSREEYLCYVASRLFGEEAAGIYLLPDGIRAEAADGRTALLGYDFSISFTDPSVSVPRLRAAIAAARAPSDGTAFDTEKATLEALLSMPEGALQDVPCTVANGYTFITLVGEENGIPLYGMQCRFGLQGDRVIHAEGNYCFGIPTEKESEPLLNRTNILFSEMERGKSGRITDIELCYTLYEDAQTGSLLFIPAYALTYADSGKTAVSAISGEDY